MRLRLELDQGTTEALARDAVRNLRSLSWQAEWILREYLGTQPETRKEREDDDALPEHSPTPLSLCQPPEVS